MGLYNFVLGTQAQAPAIYIMLGLQPIGSFDAGRVRDAWVRKGGERVIVFTRNGGGNRKHYSSEGQDAGEGCHCTGCTMTYHIPKHPQYVRDWDDDYDCTYAYIEFEVPEEYREVVRANAPDEEMPSLEVRWKEAVQNMQLNLR
jgi:hypothetical protein